MSTGTVVLQKQESIAVVTFNKPESQNALTFQLASELNDICQKIYEDQEVRAVIITGKGKESFSIGNDGVVGREPGAKGEPLSRISVASPVSTLPQPVIAAINGDALGQGLELALACDLRICASHARFAMDQVTKGNIPRDGGTQRLSRLVGKGKALELILTGEKIDAREALRIGLVHRVVSPDELMTTVFTAAQQIASKAPFAMRLVKEAVYQGMELTLEQGLHLEADLYFLLHTSQDRTEGIRAFREKRPPQFKGK
jgi:enoyl-CoA hydratase